jgi:predicted HD phosphohydrolase
VGDPIQVLADLFAFEGGQEYFGEPVTQAEHMLQAAARARLASAPPPLIAAALLHDIGHFLGPVSGADLMAGTDNRHSDVGADWLAEWFPPAVTEPVRLHVAAKRYLCAVEPRYLAGLSEASRFTLTVQGGPMSRGGRRFRGSAVRAGRCAAAPMGRGGQGSVGDPGAVRLLPAAVGPPPARLTFRVWSRRRASCGAGAGGCGVG